MRLYLLGLALLPLMLVAQSLEECQRAAEQNYPLIRQYDLIEKTTDLTVSNIMKGWLPQVSASAQATYQSDVASFPDRMQALYDQIGLEMKGLKKDQYRVGIDINQTVYDGGAMSSQAAIAREQGRVQAAQNEVNLYQVRQRVNEIYFALLPECESRAVECGATRRQSGFTAAHVVHDAVNLVWHRGERCPKATCRGNWYRQQSTRDAPV